jgi:hypothetical protein
MTRKPARPPVSEADYYYRKKLKRTDLLPAIGIGIGVGIAGFYIARLLLQRTSLGPPSRPTAALPAAPAVIYRRRGRSRPDGG